MHDVEAGIQSYTERLWVVTTATQLNVGLVQRPLTIDHAQHTGLLPPPYIRNTACMLVLHHSRIRDFGQAVGGSWLIPE